LLSVLLSTNAYAAITLTNYKFPDGTDCKVSVTGSFDIGIVKVSPTLQNSFTSEANRTEKDILPFSLADLGITADFDNEIIQYGVTLGIMPTSFASRSINSSAYLKTNGFEVNIGNIHAAAAKLTISNFTGGPIGSPCMAMFYSKDIQESSCTIRDGLSYLSVRKQPGHDRARSITFGYNADLGANTNFKIAASFIPTDGAVGSVSHSELEFRNHPYIENLFIENQNAFSFGGKLSHTMNSATFAISVAHEFASETVFYRKTKDGMVSIGSNSKDLNIKNYKATSIGASLKFENFEIIAGGSYLYDSFSSKALTTDNYETYANVTNINSELAQKDQKAEEARVKTIKEYKFDSKALYGFIGGSININDFSIGVKYGMSKNLLSNEFGCWSIMGQYQITGFKFYVNVDICQYDRKNYASLLKIEDKSISDLAKDFNITTEKDGKDVNTQTKEKLFEFAPYNQTGTDGTAIDPAANQIQYKGGYQNKTVVFAAGMKFSF